MSWCSLLHVEFVKWITRADSLPFSRKSMATCHCKLRVVNSLKQESRNNAQANGAVTRTALVVHQKGSTSTNYGGYEKSCMTLSTLNLGDHGTTVYQGHAGVLVSTVGP